MEYITGLAALNNPSDIAATGDWHGWSNHIRNPLILDTESSPFGTWMIRERLVDGETIAVADHPRAALDLVEQGLFSDAQGMREYYIADTVPNDTIYEKVYLLRDRSNWKDITNFMGREYLCSWLDWLEDHDIH